MAIISNTRRLSRATGAIWLAYFVAAMPLALRARLIVPDSAAVTAGNIRAADLLYRATLVSDLISYALYICFGGLLYLLIRDVNRGQAALGTAFTFAGCVVLITATSMLAVPLFLLDPSWAHVMNLADRQELTMAAIRLYGEAYTIALFLFGAQWIMIGPLLARSGIAPRAIGWLLALAGSAWITLSFATLLSPPVASSIRGVAMPLGGLAEIGLALWLLFKGGMKAA